MQKRKRIRQNEHFGENIQLFFLFDENINKIKDRGYVNIFYWL